MDDKENLEQYAGAISAWNSRLPPNGRYGVGVCTLWATHKGRAYELALEAAIESFPVSDGWTMHNATVMVIPPWEEL